MVNTKIRLIKFLEHEDPEPLHSHEKEYQDLNVAEIVNSLLQNSDLN